MADSGKIEHIRVSIMERFSVRSLSEIELTSVVRHLSVCLGCQANLVSTLRRQRGDTDLSFTLAPEFWLRHEHLDYDQLVDLADDKLDAIDREFIDDHLRVCPPCEEDVRSFLAFRRQIAPEFRVSYAPVEQEPVQEPPSWVGWWHRFAWKPVYSAVVVLVGIVLLIGAALLLMRKTNNQQAQQPTPQVSPASTPVVATSVPSPTASPNESPIENLTHAKAVVLRDQGRTITADKSGNITGLDDVPALTRNEIAQVLLSGRIERPPILKKLSGEDSTLRGSNRNQSFKLISPHRTVIVSDRPTFKWESVAGASAYTVYINDARAQIVARSEALTPDRREWLVPKPLKRGEIYAWIVTTVVDGKEIISPGPAAPETKFQILSLNNFRQLNDLKQIRSHLALGIFCARVGLNEEARQEFDSLLRLNPKSATAMKLFHSFRQSPR